MATVKVLYLGAIVDMEPARAAAMVAAGQAVPVKPRPESATVAPHENASRPHAKPRKAGRNRRG